MSNWTITRTNSVVSTMRFGLKRNKEWEQWMLLTADAHIDNPKTDLKMLKRHFGEAADRRAPVMTFGDFFCAMQGKDDKRSFKPDLKEENKSGDYLGSLVRSGLDLLDPYKETVALVGEGNHESAVRKRHEFDLTAALCDRLNDRGSPVVRGGYRGWVRMQFEATTFRQSLMMYFTHGAGGGGEVTKGVIKTNRRAAYIDADIIVGGHIHEAWMLELRRVRVNDAGHEYATDQIHLALPTYKEEFLGTSSGYHHENERPPKPLGAWWLRFFWNGARVVCEPTRAK